MICKALKNEISVLFSERSSLKDWCCTIQTCRVVKSLLCYLGNWKTPWSSS